MALTDKLTAIGDAIREKTGKSELLTLDAMPEQIRSIETGGNSGGGGDFDASAIEDGFINKTYPSGAYYNDRITNTLYDYQFTQNFALTSVNMPNLTRIETGAFYHCDNLEEINFPNVTYIGSQAFSYCSLKNVYLPSITSLTGSCYVRCEKMETICLPNATISYASALNYCLSLWKCDFHKMTSINNIFRGCGALTTLIIRTDTVCSLTSSSNLSDTPIASGNGYIYVPASLIEEYKVATNWATYANQFRAIEDYPDICSQEVA